MRAYLGLMPIYYPHVSPGDLIRAEHIVTAQQLISELWYYAGMGIPVFSTTPVIGSIISVADMADLRTKTQQVESVK
jgi:hypothetical protein